MFFRKPDLSKYINGAALLALRFAAAAGQELSSSSTGSESSGPEVTPDNDDSDNSSIADFKDPVYWGTTVGLVVAVATCLCCCKVLRARRNAASSEYSSSDTSYNRMSNRA